MNGKLFKNMNTLDYIINEFNIDINLPLPIELPHFGRDEMAVMFGELGFKVGAEIGVCDGTYSEVLCRVTPGLKLYGIDLWEPYAEYGDYRKRSTFQKMIDDTRRKMIPYNFIEVKKYSMDAVKDFEDCSLDFVYIDANHEDPWVTDDIREWYKKVKIGGILSGHDYIKIREDNPKAARFFVKNAIDKFTRENNISPWFTTGSGAPQVRSADRYKSWIVIKQ